MYKNKQFLLIILILGLFFFACTSEKRLYNPGYNITWKTLIKNDRLISSAKLNLPLKSNIGLLNLIDSKNNATALLNNSKSNILFFENISSTKDSCDNIILKNGNEIYAKVIEITAKEVKYKKCENKDGPTYVIEKTDIFMIKYVNGTKDIFESNNSKTKTNDNPTKYNSIVDSIYYANQNNNNNSDVNPIVISRQKSKEEQKSSGFGITSFCIAMVGLLGLFFGMSVYVYLILNLLALIFGAIGMKNHKLKGLAISGFWIGLIGLFVLLLILLVG
ncbi:MAG: hypothetical protein HXX09_13720 [Bacteroidetes bacterium]|nr:hypothetical protein [Bacteroidota bacterium]